MEIHSDFVKWVKELGYNGQIPENLICICNNSTKFIWEQLMQNVRPKQEVEAIRRNIILNRLKMKPLNKQDDFVYKVREIEEYKQKLDVEQKLKLMNEVVEEKQYKVEQLSQNCNMKDVCIDFLKNKIKENEQRQYLLDAKRKQLELQNVEAEEILTKLKNVTPIERADQTSIAKKITETLEKCVEKLNKILLEKQKTIADKLYKPIETFPSMKKKSTDNQSSVATYLSTQEKEHFEEIARSCRKKDTDKDNIDLNMQEDVHKRVKQKMFATPQTIDEDSEKSTFRELGVCLLSPNENSGTDHSSSFKHGRSESLGILPDSCLEVDTSFLCSIQNVSNKFIAVPTKLTAKKFCKIDESIKADLYQDVGVNRKLEMLLHSNNRELIYETLMKCIQNVKVDFTKIISMAQEMDDRRNEISQEDIAKLKFVHVQTELKIIEHKRVLKDLVAKIGSRKLQFLNSIRMEENRSKLQEWLDLNIKHVAIDASLAAMKKEINCSKIDEDNDNDLQVLQSKVVKIKHEIANKIQLIQLAVNDLYATQNYIAATRESVLSLIWHLKMLRTDIDWMDPLLENTWFEEMRVFESFPLEYQRKCVHTDPKIFYRDLCTDNYPQATEISPDDLQLISEILESPFSPPETILLNVLKAQFKLNVLKSIRNWSSNDSLLMQYRRKYSFEELEHQESYLQFALDRLKSLMSSATAHKPLILGEVVKQAMDIWIDMPIKEIISDKRLFNGQNYQFYQRKLDGFL